MKCTKAKLALLYYAPFYMNYYVQHKKTSIRIPISVFIILNKILRQIRINGRRWVGSRLLCIYRSSTTTISSCNSIITKFEISLSAHNVTKTILFRQFSILLRNSGCFCVIIAVLDKSLIQLRQHCDKQATSECLKKANLRLGRSGKTIPNCAFITWPMSLLFPFLVRY